MDTDNLKTADTGSVEVLFLGTGAADWPAQPPDGGAEHRRFASALVDGCLLIDPGPAVPEALATFGADRAAITDVLLTHSHSDHFSAAALQALAARPGGIRLWADAGALERIQAVDRVERHAVRPGESFTAAGLQVTPLPANHLVEGSDEQALHYVLEREQRALLYATDGAWMLKPAWQALRGKHLDAVVWDATIGDVEGDCRIFEHNSLSMLRVMAATLREQGVLKPDARIVLTHLARTLHPPHAQLCAQVAPDGFLVAYDGWAFGIR